MALTANKYFLSVVLFCFVLVGSSQVRYSNKASYILAKPETAGNCITEYASVYPDTSTRLLHNYVTRNFMGNIGLPQPDYLLNYKTSPLGFRFYPVPFGLDMISQQQVEYYRTEGPYASLTGIAGSKQEQMFKLLYSHTLRKKLNITVRFNRYGSKGFYLNQQTFTNNFYTSQNYTTENKRFGFYSYLLYNKIKYQENGGLKEDSLFVKDATINKELLPVKLSNARRNVKELNAVINPWLKLNKRSDSTALVSHYLDYKLSYTGNAYQYVDPESDIDGFYHTFYIDTTQTADSTHLRQFINQANYTLKFNKLGLAASVGYTHEYNQFYQYGDSIFSHGIVNALISYKKLYVQNDSTIINRNKSFKSAIRFGNIVSGPNSGDTKLEWSGQLQFRLDENGQVTRKTSRLFFDILSEQRHPDCIYNFSYTNHFRWNNAFKPQQLQQARVGAAHSYSGLSLSVLYQNYTNFLYFDTLATPKQADGVVSNWSAALNFEKVFFKHLGLRANIIYQTTNAFKYQRLFPSSESVSLYYYGNLFKNNLQLQVGVQGELYQEFRAYDYMPATNVFFLQNKKTVGDYPFVDFYISARIRPVQFFVKVDNVLQGLVGSNYYFVPGYIQPDRAFHFGLTWLFFD